MALILTLIMTNDEKKSAEVGARWPVYLAANALFWGFLAVLFLVAHLTIKDTSALLFVLGTLGLAFTVVSVGDWLFERHDARTAAAEHISQPDNLPSGK